LQNYRIKKIIKKNPTSNRGFKSATRHIPRKDTVEATQQTHRCRHFGGKASGFKIRRRAVACYLVTLFVSLLLSLSTSAQAANDQTKVYQLNLPEQNVAKALNSLSEQTDIQVLFPYEIVEAKKVNAVVGTYTLQKALDTMLHNTGLYGGLTESGVIMISLNELNQNGKGKRNMKIQINQRKHLLATFIAVFGAGAVSSGVMAQDGNDAATSQRQLDEIIVTAQKREESIQDVPFSVNALTGDFMEKNNLTDLVNLEFYVPGLDISETSPNGNDFSLRGIPNGGSFLGVSSVMDVYWNGTPIPQEVALGAMFDMERVEVLRGPQGSLQGRPAPAGAIMLHSRRPDVGQDAQYGGRLRSKLRNDGGYEVEGGVSVSLIPDELAVRVAGFYSDDDGRADFVNNVGQGPGRNTTIGRVTVAWEPRDDFSAVLTSQRSDRQEDGVVSYFSGSGLLGFVTPYENSRTLLDYDEMGRRYSQHNLELKWDVSGHRLISLTGYGKNSSFWNADADRATAAIRPYSTDKHREQFVQEFRLESQDRDFWEYMVGVYYLKHSFDFAFSLPTISVAGEGADWQRQLGIFTSHKLNFTDKLTLSAGLRWQSYEDWRSTSDILRKQEAPSWSAQLSYDFRDDVMGYASYQRSFRPAGGITDGTSTLSPDFFEYDEEVSDAVELGLKATVLDGRLQLNVNVYRQEFDGFIGGIRGVSTDVDLDGVFTYSGNSSSIDQSSSYPTNSDVVSQGIELEWQALLTDNWVFSGSVARNGVKYGGDVDIPCTIRDGAGTPVFPVGQHFSTCDVSGLDLDEVRKLTVSMSTEYTFSELFDWADWYIRGTYNLQGTLPTELNTTYEDLGSVGVYNLYTGLQSNDGQWDVSLWIENVGDKQGFTDILQGSNFQTRYNWANGFVEERRFGVTVGYNF